MQKKSYIKYLATLLLFGTNGIIASFISLDSYEIVFLRTLIGGVLLVALYLSTRPKISFYKHKRSLLFVVLSGVSMGMNWMFLFEAFQQVGVSIAILICFCGPVIIMALSPLLFREKLTIIKIIGFIAVLLGLFLVNRQALDFGKPSMGLLFAGISAVMYAAMVIFNKKSTKIVGMENATIQVLSCLVTVTVFIGFKQGLIIHVATIDWIPILILGLINTGIGCYLYFSSIGYLPAQSVAICGYLEPLAAVVFSAMFLKEILSPIQLVGAVLIIGGAVFAEAFNKRISNPTSIK